MVLRPLIAICGTTGVGKSNLAIELALKLTNGVRGGRWRGAKIINADSMQVYAGMDIITNKVPESEREGIEHHLMGFKEPGEQYVVGQWVQDAIQIIEETHVQNQIPIVVGGTSYWIQHLMFPNRLTSSFESNTVQQQSPISSDLVQAISRLPPTLLELLNALPEQPPSASANPEEAFSLYNLLMELDEPVASRWHWRDTRKVLRSLRIIKDTGRKPSEIINEQSSVAVEPRYRTLCFWLYADPPTLNGRLDTRVDDMIKQGLLGELLALQKIASKPRPVSETCQDNSMHAVEASAASVDYTLGIYQSIGYKEFHGYLSSPSPSDEVFRAAVEDMKHSTRKYAKRQVSWIQLGDQWALQVRDRAEDITDAFLELRDLPDPLTLSATAREMLSVKDKPTEYDPECF
ncbi:hypothetical protein SERLA73DRAFT_154555 [Serpula lacrymans var. lacrymans S7.3]|uniref:Uncharacterized protein n=1 Tax=Serpula lacrymans var. lacrymans (strain S7.3) TaxID=936435 RepID=F8Q688_SERL3|nr:hypothetical protein SERLA73DRAFT_154555 [Serpula lacrymans var. lacrymans S7.3]